MAEVMLCKLIFRFEGLNESSMSYGGEGGIHMADEGS